VRNVKVGRRSVGRPIIARAGQVLLRPFWRQVGAGRNPSAARRSDRRSQSRSNEHGSLSGR